MRLSDLIEGHEQEVRRMVRDDEIEPLPASRCHRIGLPAVYPASSTPGKWCLADGFHRMAGMIAAGETRLPVRRLAAKPTVEA